MRLDLRNELNSYVKIASTIGLDGKKYLDQNADLDDKWKELVSVEARKLFFDNGDLNFGNLEKFRRENIFVSDIYPVTDYSNLSPLRPFVDLLKKPSNFLKIIKDYAKELIHGTCIGNRRLLREILSVLEAEGALDILEKYPANKTPGNPYIFKYKGYFYNYRWARHIYFTNLVRKYLKADIESEKTFISMDIGCSYGIFPYMFKSEFPKTTQVLLDFPDQLILAKYFLGSLFPEAKIKNSYEFREKGKITREDIESLDFFFLTINDFDMVEEGAIDMVSNFFSFGEMRREWFEKYMESKAFKGTRYLFTVNRFESSPRFEPTYDTDLTIRDYPLHKFDKKFFAINPIYPYYVVPKLFRYEMKPLSSQYFDFIGKR